MRTATLASTLHATGRGLLAVALGLSVVAASSPTTAGAAPATFTYSGPPLPIPEDALGSVSAPLEVDGLGNSILDVDVRIGGTACTTATGSTTVGIDHPSVSDLYVLLYSPAGTHVDLVWRSAGGANLCQLLFDDEAEAPRLATAPVSAAPFTGTWSPLFPLSRFDGEDPNGTWRLVVEDTVYENTGTLRAFSVTIDATERVDPVSPGLAWAEPAAITYGTPLSTTQLNATADVPGTYTYAPAEGTVLDAGSHTLSVTFVPDDDDAYLTETTTVPLTVDQQPTSVTWVGAGPITYGSPVPLSALGSVAGTLAYDPPLHPDRLHGADDGPARIDEPQPVHGDLRGLDRPPGLLHHRRRTATPGPDDQAVGPPAGQTTRTSTPDGGSS